MRRMKLFGAAGALLAAALVGGTLINVVAASPSTSPSGSGAIAAAPDAAKYCQTFLNDFAKNLNVSPSALGPAAKAAAASTIDAAVAAGDLSKAVGDRMKQRIASASGDGCGLLAARWRQIVGRVARGEFRSDLFSAAATSLKLTPAQLRDKLATDRTLPQVAASQGVAYATVEKAVLDAARTDLDKAVAAGKMTKDRETQVLARLQAALTDGKLFSRAATKGAAPAAPSPSGSPAA